VRSVTIVDVARAAGVSKTTASDALRGGGRVAAGTREAVEAAAERLGFRPNRSARSLRSASNGAIGLYLPQVRVPSDYYWAFLYSVVELVAAADGDVVIAASGSSRRRSYADGVDGIVVCDPREDDPEIASILGAGVPVVTCEPVPGGPVPAGVVWSDPVRWTRALLDHLAEVGVGRPALLGTTTRGAWALGVQSTYRQWCAEHDAEPVVATAAFGTPAGALYELVIELLGRHGDLDAIVCLGDSVASAIQPAIVDAGRTPGGDLLVASCSESHVPPHVEAVIDTRGAQAGAMCADLLIGLLAGRVPHGASRELELEILTAR